MIRKILVATDFSPTSIRAQRTATELAKQLDASVTVLHVYSLPTYMFFDGSAYIPPPGVVADIIADAAKHLAEAKDAAASAGVPVETALMEGSPADEIVRYAAEHQLDLIVVGTHGRRGLSRLALGSVAEHVVRTAKVPVLAVPRADREA
jgi:nucleotide-binding universal stress UspA family protein